MCGVPSPPKILSTFSENFAQLGLSDVITCIHRDAYKDGFLVDDIVTPNSIDGAMLDLPSPWLALDHIDIVLKVTTDFPSLSVLTSDFCSPVLRSPSSVRVMSKFRRLQPSYER